MSDEQYEFTLRRTDDELNALEHEWLELYTRTGSQNPFSHPAWVAAWLRHYVTDSATRRIVTVRENGRLVALAPFYLRTYGRRPVAGRCLQLVGGGGGHGEDPFTEMGEILIAGRERRKVMRAVLHHLAEELSDEYDWLGLVLTPEQGWFDNRWLPDAWRRAGAIAHHKESRPFVVLPLPAEWSELCLKRNMKEAIRRAKNRLGAIEPAPELRFVTGEGLPEAVRQVQDMHRLRSHLQGHVPHRDDFREARREFAIEAVEGLGRTGHAEIALVSINGSPIAGRVLLRAHGSLFLSFSGLDPEYWRVGAGTFIIAGAIRRAIENGDRSVNFSGYPDDSKSRWSEECLFYNQFVVVPPRRRSRRVFGLYWLARARRSCRFESQLHQTSFEES